MTQKKTFVIIDSNAVVHRSYHALPPLTSPKGELVNAVYGYTALLLKVLRELAPDYIAAAFDLAGPTFRHEAFKDYKATRVKAPDELYAQIPLVKKVLGAFHIPVYAQQGFEADDVIGTIAKKLHDVPGVACIIVTGDLDTLQLVDARTHVYTLKSGLKEAFIYDEGKVRERFGISPVQLPDFKGLKGDPSDNIPGVPGIGDKTASALLQKFETLEKLYESLELKTKNQKLKTTPWQKPLTEKLAKLLVEYRDQAFFSKELATINCAAPITFNVEDASRAQYERKDVVTLFRDLGFLSLIERLPMAGGDGTMAATPQSDARVAAETTVRELDKESLQQLEREQGPLYIHVTQDELLSTVVPGVVVLARGALVCAGEFTKAVDVRHFRAVCEDVAIPKAAHGTKTLCALLQKHGTDLAGVAFDTELAYALMRSNVRDTSLATVVLQELGEEWQRSGDEKKDAAHIAAYLARLHSVLEEKIARQGLGSVFNDIELPLTSVLLQMEARGIRIDTKKIAAIAKRFEKELTKLETDIHTLAGKTFNINSTKELREVLFENMQLGGKGLRKTAKGVTSTQASELEKLKSAHPIVEKILAYREFFKIKTTYLDTLPALVKEDGRVHTTYLQLGASTGRLASEQPNLQNIPVRGDWGKEIRSVFTAEAGRVLLAADYSQLQLRIAAHLSKDPVMCDAFKRGEDIHARTAAVVFGVAAEKVTKDMRAQAKTLNFGVLYGMGPQAFAETAGVSVEKAKSFISDYFREFAALAGYLDAVKAEAAAKGYVETLFGRRRYIPEMHSTNFAVKRAGERMAINMPIQGTEADMVKLAMVRIAKRLAEKDFFAHAQMLLTVHDELVFETDHVILEKVATMAKHEMENVVELDVPLTVECKEGKNWGEMKSLLG